MKGVSVLILIALSAGWASAQFLNHRPFPTYSLENMPDTQFSCSGKILGGYYADADTMCQMFHICVKIAGVGVQDYRFLCPNGTAFDQDHQICAEWEDVDCDATTLYYSSDNFDLYRIGSGFESKAVKYGEEEETFALQRAETGDVRLNKEHQSQRVNQQKELQVKKSRPQNVNNNNNNNERDIFKGSSSSNFFNNKNGGKETDEDYDDNVNANQDRDDVQKRKLVRTQNRRPVQNENQNQRRPDNNDNNQNQRPQSRRPVQNDNQQNVENKNEQYNQRQQNRRPVQNENQQTHENNNEQQYNPRPQNRRPVQNEAQTVRPNRPTGFTNNFAGSSYVPTTSRPTTTTTEVPSTTFHQQRRGGQRRVPVDRQYNNAENFRQTNSPTPTYTVSTPAPFKQTQQYNNPPTRGSTQNYNNGQYNPTTAAPQKEKETENYPVNFPKQNQNYPTTPQKFSQRQTDNYPTQAPVNKNTQFNSQYDVQKVKQTTQAPVSRNTQYSTQYDVPKVKQTQNYPTQAPSTANTQYSTNYDVPKVKSTQFKNDYSTQFNKKATTPVKQIDNNPTTFAPKTFKPNQGSSQFTNNYPSTFAPRTNAAYTQVSQQTTQYKSGSTQNQQNSQSTYNQPQSSTPKTTPFTQYTPTVPKITSTTPVSRSSRFDETQYDDGSYNRRDDEFLKTAHSQNIASSRNELAKTTKNVAPSTQKPYYESPRPFSVSSNTPKANDVSKSTPRTVENKVTGTPSSASTSGKKVKDVSYDYAYYDTNVGSEPEYEIDTEFKKSTAKN